MTCVKVIENEIIDWSDVIYVDNESDDECCLNEDTYYVPGEDDLFGYDSDNAEEIPLDEDTSNELNITDLDLVYDSDDDKDKTGYELGLQYCEQNKQ